MKPTVAAAKKAMADARKDPRLAEQWARLAKRDAVIDAAIAIVECWETQPGWEAMKAAFDALEAAVNALGPRTTQASPAGEQEKKGQGA